MTRNEAPALWQSVHDDRRALFIQLQNVSPENWELPTGCAGWNVHDVLAHVVDTAKTSRLIFVREMLMTGFNFDAANERGLMREKQENPLLTLAEFGNTLELTLTPPAAIETRLVEAYVHGEDIRRALGIKQEYPAEQVALALDYQLHTTVKFGGGRERAAGFRLQSADNSNSWGSGVAVEGSSLSLLLAVSGRHIAPEEVNGPGAKAFLERCLQ